MKFKKALVLAYNFARTCLILEYLKKMPNRIKIEHLQKIRKRPKYHSQTIVRIKYFLGIDTNKK